jgi:hypothetical protein
MYRRGTLLLRGGGPSRLRRAHWPDPLFVRPVGGGGGGRVRRPAQCSARVAGGGRCTHEARDRLGKCGAHGGPVAVLFRMGHPCTECRARGGGLTGQRSARESGSVSRARSGCRCVPADVICRVNPEGRPMGAEAFHRRYPGDTLAPYAWETEAGEFWDAARDRTLGSMVNAAPRGTPKDLPRQHLRGPEVAVAGGGGPPYYHQRSHADPSRDLPASGPLRGYVCGGRGCGERVYVGTQGVQETRCPRHRVHGDDGHTGHPSGTTGRNLVVAPSRIKGGGLGLFAYNGHDDDFRGGAAGRHGHTSGPPRTQAYRGRRGAHELRSNAQVRRLGDGNLWLVAVANIRNGDEVLVNYSMDQPGTRADRTRYWKRVAPESTPLTATTGVGTFTDVAPPRTWQQRGRPRFEQQPAR